MEKEEILSASKNDTERGPHRSCRSQAPQLHAHESPAHPPLPQPCTGGARHGLAGGQLPCVAAPQQPQPGPQGDLRRRPAPVVPLAPPSAAVGRAARCCCHRWSRGLLLVGPVL